MFAGGRGLPHGRSSLLSALQPASQRLHVLPLSRPLLLLLLPLLLHPDLLTRHSHLHRQPRPCRRQRLAGNPAGRHRPAARGRHPPGDCRHRHRQESAVAAAVQPAGLLQDPGQAGDEAGAGLGTAGGPARHPGALSGTQNYLSYNTTFNNVIFRVPGP